RFLIDECGNLRPRDGPTLGRRAPGDRPRSLETPLRLRAVAEPGEHLPAVQPGGDVLRTQLRRLRVAAVRVFEPAHPRKGDPLVVPGDRVLRVEPDRFVVAFERLRELVFPEVYRPEVAPRDLVRRVQTDRVLVTPQGLVEPAEVLHRDAARRPRIRGPADHPDRALVMREGVRVAALFDQSVSLRHLAVRKAEEAECRGHAADGDAGEEEGRQRIRRVVPRTSRRRRAIRPPATWPGRRPEVRSQGRANPRGSHRLSPYHARSRT